MPSYEENNSELPTDDEQADGIHIWGGKESDPKNYGLLILMILMSLETCFL